MSTQKEREEDAVKSDELIKLASGKNKEADKYLRMLGHVYRVLDDVYDGDFPITRGDIFDAIEYLLIGIPSNRFFIHHQDKLTSQHITAYNAWMAANRWTKGNLEQRVFSHVWRGDYQAVIGLVALLTQGVDQMKLVDQKVRETFGLLGEDFDINKLGE
tara:strand:+ start:887 stop:1363 length:477 start_codon:yes stop_codon:yes gene_type:complete